MSAALMFSMTRLGPIAPMASPEPPHKEPLMRRLVRWILNAIQEGIDATANYLGPLA